MGHKIIWFDIPVTDLERASNFYRQVLEINIAASHGNRSIVKDSEGNRIVLHSESA